MAQSPAANTFQFINSSDSLLPEGRDIRTTIRKQAMSRAAAARRQKGNYGRHNLGQYPIHVESSQGNWDAQASDDELSRHSACDSHLLNDPTQSPKKFMSSLAIPARPSITGYESMRIQLDFDILDLSALTTFHAGRATARSLAQDPSRLADILRCRQWSYFSFLPSRFGYSTCLDDAIRCVAARVRHWMVAPAAPPDTSVLALYSRALGSLQCALDEPTRRLQPDVLCATEILAIYELVDLKGNQAWIRHVAGATSLVKLRGPERYETDFEKALILAQAGPIFTEAMLNGDTCFLEQDAWQAVLCSIVLETSSFSERSNITISLWITVCHIPRLLNEVDDALESPQNVDLTWVDHLVTRLYHLRTTLMGWLERYDTLILNIIPARSSPGLGKDKRHETLGVAMGMLIVLNRSLVALNTSLAMKLEPQTQALATRIMDLQRQAYVVNPRAGLFMAFKIIVAQATLATADEWRACGRCSDEMGLPRSFIRKEIFDHWCNLKGRKTRQHVSWIQGRHHPTA